MMSMQGQWIGRPDATLINWQAAVLPAPMFRRAFGLDGEVKTACLKICGLGYYELRLNGAKVGDQYKFEIKGPNGFWAQ